MLVPLGGSRSYWTDSSSEDPRQSTEGGHATTGNGKGVDLLALVGVPTFNITLKVTVWPNVP